MNVLRHFALAEAGGHSAGRELTPAISAADLVDLELSKIVGADTSNRGCRILWRAVRGHCTFWHFCAINMDLSSPPRVPTSPDTAMLLQYRGADSFGELVVTGTLSQIGAASIQFGALAHFALDGRCGLVVDLLRTSLALDGDTVATRCLDAFRSMDRLLAIAVVVTPDRESLFQRWGCETAIEGHRRAVFTRIEDARAWVLFHACPEVLRDFHAPATSNQRP